MSSADAEVIAWLLESDPAIRWQVMRDLLDTPEAEWRAERAKVATAGWGARLLALQDEDGQWAGGSLSRAASSRASGRWRASRGPRPRVLTQLRELGLDPERMRRGVALIGANSRWDHDGQPFWEGEVEECINGRTVADGAYFGVDVSPIVERLLGERQADGGWNCERERGSVRSSFASTINVLEGLLEFERATGGTPASIEARRAGEEYLLARHLFRRLTTGAPADEAFLALLYPNRWHYDVLRALDHLRAHRSAARPARRRQAVEHVRARRRDDGTWPLDRTAPRPGRGFIELDDGPGEAVALGSRCGPCASCAGPGD